MQEATGPNEPPNLPEGILEELTSRLTRDEAPFLRYLAKKLSLQWADSSNQLGYTRFDMIILNCLEETIERFPRTDYNCPSPSIERW